MLTSQNSSSPADILQLFQNKHKLGTQAKDHTTPSQNPTAVFLFASSASINMASEKKTEADRKAELKAMAERRAKVLAEIGHTCPQMRDEKFRAQQIAESKQNALGLLYDKGLNDSNKTTGAGFVAWFIERDLWMRLRDGIPFPGDIALPKPRNGPPSGDLVHYQQRRLAIEAQKARAEQSESAVPAPTSESELPLSIWVKKSTRDTVKLTRPAATPPPQE